MAFDASRYRFIADALNASGGFAPQQAAAKQAADFALGNTYLVQYPRERADKFNRRNQVAVYRNFLLSACSRFNGFLFSKKTSRYTANSLYIAMLDDIDQKGNSAEVFWHYFTLNAKARGAMLLLIDMPTELPATQADQVQFRALPYFVAIAPETVADAELNDRGAFDWVAFEVDYNEKKAWKVWTKTDWRIQEPERNGKIHLSGEHLLGECPVLIFTEQADFPCYGEFSQIADLSLSWFNQVSSRDEILRGNAFPVLTYQIGETEQIGAIEGNLTVGVSNAILYRGERPDYVSPESTSLDVHERAIDKLEAAIQEIGYHIDLTAQAEAAAALNLRFRNLSSALTLFASRMADFERRCWWMASRWLGRNDIPEIEWPSSYDIADINGELAILQQMQLSGFAPEVIAEQQKRIIRLQFHAVEQTDLNALLESAPSEHSSTLN